MEQSYTIPANCSLIVDGRISVLINNTYKPQLLKLGILTPRQLIARSLASDHKRFSGRGPLCSLPLEEKPGMRIVAKQCMRGGLIRYFSNDVFCGGNRPFEEMFSNRAIVERGIKTAEIIAAVKEKLWGPFYKAYLFSVEIPGCTDLVTYFNGLTDMTPEQCYRAKKTVFEAVADAFTFMHRVGIYHRDLHLKNVLLRTDSAQAAPEVYIIDFDKAVVKAGLSPREKLNNLMRFNRSIEKFRFSCGAITSTDQFKLCRRYLAENEDSAGLLSRTPNRYRVATKLRRLKWRLLSRIRAGKNTSELR